MRIWLGRFKGARRRGRNWNVGVHVYEDEGVPVRDVIEALKDVLSSRFPSAEIVESPSVKEALQ